MISKKIFTSFSLRYFRVTEPCVSVVNRYPFRPEGAASPCSLWTPLRQRRYLVSHFNSPHGRQNQVDVKEDGLYISFASSDVPPFGGMDENGTGTFRRVCLGGALFSE